MKKTAKRPRATTADVVLQTTDNQHVMYKLRKHYRHPATRLLSEDRSFLDFRYSRYPSIAINISFTAASKPTITARLMMLWPIFNSTRCGTRYNVGRFW